LNKGCSKFKTFLRIAKKTLGFSASHENGHDFGEWVLFRDPLPKSQIFPNFTHPICQLSLKMKTPPIQQKQVAETQQHSSTLEAEGKSLAPPAFQLKASQGIAPPPANGGGGIAKPLQMKPKDPQGGVDGQEKITLGTPGIRTITDATSWLRGGPPTFASLGTKIAQGTRVEVLEEKVTKTGTYIRIKDYDTDAELGWTSKGNAPDLDARYKNAGSTFNYHVDGHDLLVFLPKDGLKNDNPDVFMFFHGRGGDYTSTKTHAKNGGYEDNPAISAKIPDAVAQSGGIAICPQGHGFKVDIDWGAIGAGGFQKMVDTTLKRLSKDLDKTDTPLTAGNISLAGHSAGGNALGQAAMDTGATDVTLQEAGYGFDKSWKKLREWFLTGNSPKTMRVITQGNANGSATRKPVAEAKTVKGKTTKGGMLSTSEIVSYSSQLVDKGLLQAPVTVEQFEGNDTVEAGGIVLERGYRVFGDNKKLLGSMRLYHLADKDADHWAAATQTMEASMTAGKVDRAADVAAKKD
jgi:hypothetical protein